MKWGKVAQPSFVGEYQHTLDDKGRVALPARFRESLGPRFMLARGLDDCLFIYPLDEWERLVDRLKSVPISQSDFRAFARYFLAGAVEVEPDKQGRFVLPSHLREYAGLTKEVSILGVGNRLEIWDRTNWEEMKARIHQEFAKLAETVTAI